LSLQNSAGGLCGGDARTPIHHSARGVQYACGEYTALLAAYEHPAEMSRIGNPYANAQGREAL